MTEVPPTKYINHLSEWPLILLIRVSSTESAHEIIFDLDFLIQRTLRQQFPELSSGGRCDCGQERSKDRSSLEESAARMQEIFPQSITITPILKRKGTDETQESKRRRGEDEVVLHGEAVVRSPADVEPSWSLGCLYRCAICGVKFQTLTSFQSHLFFHRSSPEQYVALHGDPLVQFQQHSCLQCGEVVQQDPLHLRLHLVTHGLSLAQYSGLAEVEGRGGSNHSGEGEVVSSASSTSKSSPGAQVRQSVDNMSDSQGSSKGEKEEEKEKDGMEEDVGDVDEDIEDEDDEDISLKAEPIMTEPDIELSYFSPPHEGDFPSFPGPADLEGEVTQNIIRDLTKSAETFFQQQRSFQQQHSNFPSQYFPCLMATPQAVNSAGRIAWYHGCLYQCSIETCSRQFFEKVFLKAHVESHHGGINFDQYLADFGNANTVTNEHECELCGAGVLHTAR